MAAVALLPASTLSPPSPPSHLPLFPTPNHLSPPSLLLPQPKASSTCQHLRFRIASSGPSVAAPMDQRSSNLKEIYECCDAWTWNGFKINYLVKGKGMPLLLVHGFGASVAHWRRYKNSTKGPSLVTLFCSSFFSDACFVIKIIFFLYWHVISSNLIVAKKDWFLVSLIGSLLLAKIDSKD